MRYKHVDIIKQYYTAFNNEDKNGMLVLLHDDIKHDINQGEREIGKEKFSEFLDGMFKYCKENVKDINFMVSDIENHVAAEFTVTGIYLLSIPGFPKANNQHYELPCGSFFEIEDDRISRVTVYYNLNEWLRQIK